MASNKKADLKASPGSSPSLTSIRAGSTRSISPMSRATSGRRWHIPAQWVKTVAFTCSMLNCLSAGTILLFSLYAPIMQEKLGYTSTQVNYVSIAGALGMYLPVPFFGYICDRIGPAMLSLLSAAFFSIGYPIAAYAYIHHLAHPIMIFAFGFVGAGTSSMYFSGVTTCAKNFTGARGLALALPIAAFGLSSLWEAQLVSRLFGSSDGKDLDLGKTFCFFAVFLLVIGLIGGMGLHVVPEGAEEKPYDEESESERLLGASARSEYGTAREEVDSEHSVPVKDTRILNAATREFLSDYTMWWFAAGFFLVTGPGEAFINNMGVVLQTLYPPESPVKVPVSPTLHVSIVALTSTVSRLIAGFLSDYLAPPVPVPTSSTTALRNLSPPQKLVTCSRVTLLLIFAGIMSLGQLLVTSGYLDQNGTRFWLVSSSIGCGYGAVFTLAPTVVSVVWGTENFGTNWGIVTVTPALGASVFGLLFAKGYDEGAGRQRREDGLCYGKECYNVAFGEMALAVWLAIGLWLWAWRGWKKRGIAV